MTTSSPRLAPRLISLAAAALLLVAVWWAVSAWQDWQKGYDPETVVAASLQGLQVGLNVFRPEFRFQALDAAPPKLTHDSSLPCLTR